MAKNIFVVSALMKLDLKTFKSDLSMAGKWAGQVARGMEKDFLRASRGVESFAKNIQGLTMIGGISLGGIALGAKKMADSMGDLSDMSKQLDMSTNALSELGYAASMSGINMEKLSGGMGKMQKFLADSNAGDVLKKMGMDKESLKRAAPDEAFTKIIDALGKVKDQNTRMDLATAVFGKSGGEFLRMAKDGAAGLATLRQEARQIGASIDEGTASRWDAIGDKWDKLTKTLEVVGNAFMDKLAPAIEWTLDKLTGLSEGVAKFIADHPKLTSFATNVGTGFITIATGAGVALIAIGKLFSGISQGMKAVKNISGFLSKFGGGAAAEAGAAGTAGTAGAAGVAGTAAGEAGTVAVGAAGVGTGVAGAAILAGGLVGGAAGYGMYKAGWADENSKAGWLLGGIGRSEIGRKVGDWWVGESDAQLGDYTKQRLAAMQVSRGGGGPGNGNGMGSVDQVNRELMGRLIKATEEQNRHLADIKANTRGSGPSLMPVLVR